MEASDMGDVVKSMNRALRNGKAWTLVLAAATIWSGSAAATPESAAASSEPVPPAAAPASLPATISRLAVMEGAPGTRIELVADTALVWTTYRDADGALVIELPNTRPLPAVVAERPAVGLVSAVEVAVDETSDRPLTRLTVRTRAGGRAHAGRLPEQSSCRPEPGGSGESAKRHLSHRGRGGPGASRVGLRGRAGG
jgi:hypothetical protein